MKKLFTILIMAMFCAACLFSINSSEVHSIRLATVVGEIKPAFQLEFTSGMLSGNKVTTNISAKVFDPNAEYNEYGSQATAIDVADISRNALDLLFTAKLANRAKANGIYTLTFSTEGFAVKRKGVSGTLAPNTKTVAAAADISARIGVAVADLDEEQSIQIRFTGTECAVGDLATYRVTFQPDNTIDNGTYYSDFKLEISTES